MNVMQPITTLPGVGDPLVYYPRASEVQRGRTKVAAICTHVWPDEGAIDIVVVREADDMLTLERVPERVGGEPGWARLHEHQAVFDPATAPMRDLVDAPFVQSQEAVDLAKLRDDFDAFKTAVLKALYGKDFEPIDEPIVGVLSEFEDRIAGLEAVKPGGARKPKTTKNK